jgi:hypothetical protein
MATLFLFYLIVILFASFPAWIGFKNRVHWNRQDYLTPFLGFITWFILEEMHIKNIATLSNLLIETFWILIASIFGVWFRVVFPGKSKKQATLSSIICLAIPFITAILLRTFMPTLPE